MKHEKIGASSRAFARFEPTPKQLQWLDDLAERLGVVE